MENMNKGKDKQIARADANKTLHCLARSLFVLVCQFFQKCLNIKEVGKWLETE